MLQGTWVGHRVARRVVTGLEGGCHRPIGMVAVVVAEMDGNLADDRRYYQRR